jgi:pimeloyl-ACP methyl ester carboxylesterase
MKTLTSTSPKSQTYLWSWKNQTFEIVYDRQGQGSPVLFLPAFSTVSSRQEWAGAAEVLRPHYQVTALDWPGFGESSKFPVAYNPVLYSAFLQDFMTAHFGHRNSADQGQPLTVVAAGHAAAYALNLAQQFRTQIDRLVLVAPTWRGPLPTMGAPSKIAYTLEQLVRSPFLGHALYYLNTRPQFLAWMYRRHVFHQLEALTPAFIQEKYRSTQQQGSRFAPAAFVTGGLDPVTNRGAFLALFQGLRIPCLVVIGDHAPPKSTAEMEAIAQVHQASQIQILRHPGSLGLHEEYGTTIGQVIQSFIQS